jgi:hypothetical protein
MEKNINILLIISKTTKVKVLVVIQSSEINLRIMVLEVALILRREMLIFLKNNKKNFNFRGS